MRFYSLSCGMLFCPKNNFVNYYGINGAPGFRVNSNRITIRRAIPQNFR